MTGKPKLDADAISDLVRSMADELKAKLPEGTTYVALTVSDEDDLRICAEGYVHNAPVAALDEVDEDDAWEEAEVSHGSN
jgi:hypothetical protein